MINALGLFLVGICLTYIGHKLLVSLGVQIGGIEIAISLVFMLAGVMFMLAFNAFERGRFKS